MPARVFSFPPLARADARVLILGSMPGVASLRAGQYYAHPRNAFWRIMGELCGVPADAAYAQRVAHLKSHGVAVWDVLKSCERCGSLDTAIEHATAVPNNIGAFLRAHRRVLGVFCNGGLAHSAYRRYFGATVAREFPELAVRRLPSTSPANASYSYARKLQIWRAQLGALL